MGGLTFSEWRQRRSGQDDGWRVEERQGEGMEWVEELENVVGM